MNQEKYYFYIQKIEDIISNDFESTNASLKDLFSEIMEVEMFAPYQFILPQKTQKLIDENPGAKNAWDCFSQTLEQARASKYLVYYPYFDWQTHDPKVYIRNFILKYLEKDENPIELVNAKICTMGSCFAQNISIPLRKKGAEIFVMTNAETNNNAPLNDLLLNIDYTYNENEDSYTASPNNEMQKEFIEEVAITSSKNKVEDKNENQASTFQTVLKDTARFLHHVSTATHIVLTLGSAVGVFTESYKGVRWKPFYFERDKKTDWHELYGASVIINSMDNILNKILKINPKVKIIITLSPIPLNGMITKQGRNNISPVELDCISKSMQRVCIEKLREKRDDFEYFPAFEIVKWLAPTIKNHDYEWETPRHPKEDLIELVLDLFVEHYFKS